MKGIEAVDPVQGGDVDDTTLSNHPVNSPPICVAA